MNSFGSRRLEIQRFDGFRNRYAGHVIYVSVLEPRDVEANNELLLSSVCARVYFSQTDETELP